MINKLKKRIFGIIQISLSLVVLCVIIIFARFSYNNTINSSIIVMDRMNGKSDMRAEKPDERDNLIDPSEKNEPIGERNFEEPFPISIDGVYKFSIKEGKITRESSNDVTDEIRNKAIEVSKKKSEEGYSDNYIYKIKKVGNGDFEVTLMENEGAINRLKMTIVWAVVIGIIGLFVIAFIASRIAKIIVKPVEETFEKQKQFISDASHELKTPLAVIEANADVLRDKVGDSKWISYIQNEVQSMNKLVNDLLVLAKMENVKNTNYQKFDLSKEVQMSVAVFESMIFEKKINLETNIKDGIEFVGEREDIKQVVSILLDNAIKHTNENNKVIINTNKDKNDIEIEVKNQGAPIPDNEKDKIFERFYRVDKARNRNEKRYGLGLAIAKGIVDKYHGTIEVNCKDGFTSFIIKIKQ